MFKENQVAIRKVTEKFQGNAIWIIQASATFERFMELILKSLCCLVYFDKP